MRVTRHREASSDLEKHHSGVRKPKMFGHVGKVGRTGERKETIFRLFLALFLRCPLLITVRERILDWTWSGSAQLSHTLLSIMEAPHVRESEVESISHNIKAIANSDPAAAVTWDCTQEEKKKKKREPQSRK